LFTFIICKYLNIESISLKVFVVFVAMYLDMLLIFTALGRLPQ